MNKRTPVVHANADLLSVMADKEDSSEWKAPVRGGKPVRAVVFAVRGTGAFMIPTGETAFASLTSRGQHRDKRGAYCQDAKKLHPLDRRNPF